MIIVRHPDVNKRQPELLPLSEVGLSHAAIMADRLASLGLLHSRTNLIASTALGTAQTATIFWTHEHPKLRLVDFLNEASIAEHTPGDSDANGYAEYGQHLVPFLYNVESFDEGTMVVVAHRNTIMALNSVATGGVLQPTDPMLEHGAAIDITLGPRTARILSVQNLLEL